MEKKNEPKLYHIEEMEEYLNSILPDSSNSFKYLYLKKQIILPIPVLLLHQIHVHYENQIWKNRFRF